MILFLYNYLKKKYHLEFLNMTNPENENDFSIAEKNAKPNHEIIPHEIYMQTMIKDSSCSSPSQNSHDNPNWALRKKIFYLFLYVTIFTNYDTGVIPAALINIEKELELSYFQQGLLGSLPNFGISFASFLVSYVIGKFKAKTILFAAIVSNIMFCILLALSKNLWALYFSRFFMGFTQSFWIIYGPVWCNYFSPRERQATWLGFLQGFSPLGFFMII